jgi:hypothetical protein
MIISKKWTLFILSLLLNLFVILFIISPLIPISDSFKKSYFDSNESTILIKHIWTDNTNILLERQQKIFDYFDNHRNQNSEYLKIELTGNNPFKYVCQPIVPEQPFSLFIISGNFDNSTNNSFYVEKWHDYDSDTLLGQTNLFKEGSILLSIYLPSIILLPFCIILSICILIRTYKKNK